MKKTRYIVKAVSLILLLALLAACSGGNDDTPPAPEPPTPDNPSEPPPTLSLIVSGSGMTFTSGDKVGVFMAYGSLKQTGNYLQNLLMQSDGSSWAMERSVSWQDGSTRADLYVYAPYQASLADPLACTFEVNSDQSTAERQKASGLLWGRLTAQSPTANALTLTLKRLFARLTVKIEAGEGVTAQDLSGGKLSVRVNGVQTQAVVNLSDGSVRPAGAAGNVTPFMEQSLTYSAVIIPQQVAETGLVTVNWNGTDYTLTQAMTFESGKQHTVTVTIKKTAGTVNVGISQWETTDEDFGGTVN